MKTEANIEQGCDQIPPVGDASDMGMDVDASEDDDYIEEEMLLFTDFANYLTEEELTDSNVRIKVIGIDTEAPIIQINNDVYEGSYDFALGTNVFLEEDVEAKNSIDPLYSPNPNKVYKYAGQSSKVLKMQRIFVSPKTDVANLKTEPEVTESDTINKAQRYLVTRTYEEALNLHLPKGMFQPRHIDPDQNCEQIVQSKPAEAESDDPDDALDPDYVPNINF
ncbi:uncharacterized protein LOC131427197 [Malaya genurostris]|uniref:uncharacterized protein LOC131427197 n=1 Tax=Malaya genurostris TaxID=325434 RepID=UPI0026F3F1CC|nr:uncharacterized protein LOC131427197 [Malaya genurostris]